MHLAEMARDGIDTVADRALVVSVAIPRCVRIAVCVQELGLVCLWIRSLAKNLLEHTSENHWITSSH